MPAALERGHAFFQGRSGGVRRTRVLVAATWRADAVLDIGRGGIDGRHDGAERRIGFLPGVDCSGGETRRVSHAGEPTRGAGGDWPGGTDPLESAFRHQISRAHRRGERYRNMLFTSKKSTMIAPDAALRGRER